MVCIKCGKEIPTNGSFCPFCGKDQHPKKHKRRRGNGAGSVFFTRGSWACEWTEGFKILNAEGTITKKRVYDRKRGFKTKRDAETYLRSILSGKGEKKAETLEHIHAAWEPVAFEKLSKSTQSAYRLAWKRISPVALSPVASVTISDLQGLIQGLTYDPAKDIKDLLSILYKRAVAQGNVSANIAQYIALPDHIPVRTEKLNEDEIASLWEGYEKGDRVAGYVLLMVYTGMMPGELMKLKTDMICWEQHTIVGCGAKTKQRKTMPIVFPDLIVPVLHHLCDTTKSKTGYVLWMKRERFYDEFRKMKKRLGIRDNVKPYSARRSTGTELALAGVPPAVIVSAMRHANYQTTLEHYTLLDTTDVLDALNKI